MDYIKLLNDPSATIVDVREPFEFQSGHARGAVNIPLGSIPYRLEEFKNMRAPIVLYCRSGARSGSAQAFLQSQGIQQAYNAGGIAEVLYYQTLAPQGDTGLQTARTNA